MKLIILSLALTLLLLNCKKNQLITESKKATVFNKHPTRVTTNNDENFNLLYDQHGRLLMHTAGNAVHYYKPGSDHFLTRSGKLSNSKMIYRNSQRDASGRILKFDKYVEGKVESIIELMYNGEGYLERQIVMYPGVNDVKELLYYYADGNLVKIQEHINEELIATVLFMYDEGRVNSMGVDLLDLKQIGFVTDGQFGNQSKYLVKSVQAITRKEQTGLTFHYFYKTDVAGSVQLMTIEMNNEVIKKYRFIY